MKLDSIYARFFRSLNFDYIRMTSPGYEADPWDRTPSGDDYPFVETRLEPDITTIVGGNESGKSQMLAAVTAALTGSGYDRSDFCRYSPFFSVDKTLLLPEFGVGFGDVLPIDVPLLEKLSGISNLELVDRVAVFRMNEAPKLRVYFRQSGVWGLATEVKDAGALKELGVPTPFRIDAEIPLPDSVPIQYLATGKPSSVVSRDSLRGLWDFFSTRNVVFKDNDAVTKNAGEISAAFKGAREVTDKEKEQFKLASDLLLTVAGLDRSLFAELQTAVRTKNGYANSIVDTINAELAKSLNFPHWWSQDRQFELFVALFEFDLVFMIRDRTGRSYGFDERSDGLKYFLSYFVQYLAHKTPADGRPEILLMDEPDRFLSSSGQQDLLKIFADFAAPQDSTRSAVQVLFVTHSPFLIDKNHSERIRVLEKGEHDEGTRIVKSAAQNHYEPLRSAFGSFVGETALIGTCNLMLEGASDQILLAGISSWLLGRGAPERERLDLNSITLVPAGGVSQIPYLVYLARGRDIEQPPVIVLVDGDQAGTDAKAAIKRGGARGKSLVSEKYVLQLSDAVLDAIVTENPAGRVGIEDLIPLDVALEAASLYCGELVPDVHPKELGITLQTVFPNGGSGSAGRSKASKISNKGILGELQRTIVEATGKEGFHLDKVAFARSVLSVLRQRPSDDSSLAFIDANFRVLLRELGLRQRDAERAENVDRISSRINRARDRFVNTHKTGARKEQVLVLIEEIEGQLDNSLEAEEVRAGMRALTTKFKLDEDPRENIEDLAALITEIKSLAYTGIRLSAGEDF